MYASYRPVELSPLELLFLRGGNSIMYSFLSSCDPASIVLFASANSRTRGMVELYKSHAWNLSTLLGYYFGSPEPILAFMRNEDAYLFGPSIFCFFDRQPYASLPIDICIRVDSVPAVSRLLEQLGFTYIKRTEGNNCLHAAVVSHLFRTIDRKLKSSGDRNSSQRDRSSWVFDFYKKFYFKISDFRRQIRLHVVRCDPHQHITSLHSSGLMNFVTWKCAISLFPRSTFLHRVSFVSRQEFLESDELPYSQKRWLEEYGKGNRIKIIDISAKVYSFIESGSRFVGDRDCWTMNIGQVALNSGLAKSRYEGPSFEVLDWRSGMTMHESYLRIGEPGVWSTWSKLRQKIIFSAVTVL